MPLCAPSIASLISDVSCKWSVLCLDWSEERGMREAMSSLSGGQLDYVIATGECE